MNNRALINLVNLYAIQANIPTLLTYLLLLVYTDADRFDYRCSKYNILHGTRCSPVSRGFCSSTLAIFFRRSNFHEIVWLASFQTPALITTKHFRLFFFALYYKRLNCPNPISKSCPLPIGYGSTS